MAFASKPTAVSRSQSMSNGLAPLDRPVIVPWAYAAPPLKAAFLLRPVHSRLFQRLKASPKLFADEITGFRQLVVSCDSLPNRRLQ